MPLYEYRKNAINHVTVTPEVRQGVVCGTKAVLHRMVSLTREKSQAGRSCTAAVDGWYGVDWEGLEAGLREEAKTQGLALELVRTAELYKRGDAIEAYRQPFVTEDPSFGRVNGQGILEDILDEGKVAELKRRLDEKAVKNDGTALMVIGPGAAVATLAGSYDLRFYADFTMQPLLWQMWDGKLVTFGTHSGGRRLRLEERNALLRFLFPYAAKSSRRSTPHDCTSRPWRRGT